MVGEGLCLVIVGASPCALCCLKRGGGRWSDVFGFPDCFLLLISIFCLISRGQVGVSEFLGGQA
jgi:hypothetical protein